MRHIFNVFLKEVLHLRRDKRVLFILFIAPVLQIVLLGLAATLDVKEIPVALIKGGNKEATRRLEGILNTSPYFHFTGEVFSFDEGLALMKEGKTEVLLYPRDRWEVIIDGINSNNAIIIASYITRLFAEEFPDPPTLTLFPPVSVHVLYNEQLSSRNFFVPGVFGTILLVMTMVLTALSIVREKERGTIESIVTTPLSRSAFIIGKLSPYVIIGLIDASLIFLVAVFLLKVPFRGSPVYLFLFCFLYVLNTLGGGIFFSVISRTQQQAMMSIFLVMLPLIILSGFIFPVENMPFIFRIIAKGDPLYYFLHAIRGIFLKGVGLSYLIEDLIALFVTGLLILTLSIRSFRKTIG